VPGVVCLFRDRKAEMKTVVSYFLHLLVMLLEKFLQEAKKFLRNIKRGSPIPSNLYGKGLRMDNGVFPSFFAFLRGGVMTGH